MRLRQVEHAQPRADRLAPERVRRAQLALVPVLQPGPEGLRGVPAARVATRSPTSQGPPSADPILRGAGLERPTSVRSAHVPRPSVRSSRHMAILRVPAAVSSRLSDQRGVTLVETLISAVILAIVVGAVLSTIDASGRTAAVNKNRSVAATLAEQDQERMRAMTPTALSGHTFAQDVRPEGPSGPVYHVDSKAEWVFDASGATESCNNDSGTANYIRISSHGDVQGGGHRVQPIVMRSIVAPRVDSFADSTGTLTVKVTDQLAPAGAEHAGLHQPGGQRAEGHQRVRLRRFSHIPTGAYTATIERAGWVNELRQQRYDKSTTVNKNQTTSLSLVYAPAAAVQVRFTTRPNGSSGAGDVDRRRAHRVERQERRHHRPRRRPPARPGRSPRRRCSPIPTATPPTPGAAGSTTRPRPSTRRTRTTSPRWAIRASPT